MAPVSVPVWEIYQKQLFLLGHGWPLWDPAPESDDQELDIGSVIYNTGAGGRYTQLFNSTKPADDPTNLNKGVPDSYKPFTAQNISTTPLLPLIKQCCLYSRTIRSTSASVEPGIADPMASIATIKAGVKFVCKDEVGAFLMIDPPGMGKFIQSKRHIVNYMRQNFDSWMDMANEKYGLELTQDGLYFVSGTIKTSRWYTAAVEGAHYREREGSIQCDFAHLGGLQASVSIANESLRSGEYNYGPFRVDELSTPLTSPSAEIVFSSSSSAPNSVSYPRNQCIFIHYYKMKRRFLWKKPMKAAAGPHILPPGDDPRTGDPLHTVNPHHLDDDSDFEDVPGHSQAEDPVDILLDYILGSSDAEIAIGTDRDVIVLFQETGIPHDIEAALTQLKPLIDIDEDGVGTISVDVRYSLPVGIDDTSAAEVGGKQYATSEVDEPLPIQDDEGAKLPTEGVTGATQGDYLDDAGSTEDKGEHRRQVLPLHGDAAPGHTGMVTALAVSPDSKWVASGSDDTWINLWDVWDHTLNRRWPTNSDVVRHVEFSPDSTRLASSGDDGRVKIWAIPSGELCATFEQHTEPVHDVAWSPDGRTVASASDDTTACLWDVERGALLHVLQSHHTVVTFVEFSHDGRWLATGGADYMACLWDVQTGSLHRKLVGHSGMVWTASFDPDDNRIATASDDGSVRIWKVETGEELVTLGEHHGPVWAVQFSDDGKEVLSGSSDATVKVCDSFSGEKRLSIEGHGSMVNTAQFSPDGRFIASASADKTVRLWARADGAPVVTFNEHNDKVSHACFSPDGRTLSSGSDDGSVCIRDLRSWVPGDD